MKRVFVSHPSDKIASGLEKLKDAVAPTLGPLGSLVLLDKLTFSAHATKDGANIAREMESEDKVEDMAIRVCRELSLRTEEEAGDGTTSSIIVAEALWRLGKKAIEDGMHYHELLSQLKNAEEEVLDFISTYPQSSEELLEEELRSIIRVSSNYDEELVGLLSEALEKTNRAGTVLIEEARGLDTTLEIVPGFSFDKGVVSPYLYTNPEREECLYENARVFVYKSRLDSIDLGAKLLGKAKAHDQPLLILCDEISPEVLSLIVVNKLQGGIKVTVAHPPYHGQQRWWVYEDVAALTGTKVYDKSIESTIEYDLLGLARKIQMGKKRTVILTEQNDLGDHLERIQTDLNKESSQTGKAYYKERIARLSGGVAHIRIGAPTPIELREKKDRAMDAYLAARSALEEGVVPGGGLAFHLARNILGASKINQSRGKQILLDSLLAPMKVLAENAGKKWKDYDEAASKGKIYDGRSGKYVDPSMMGILDPIKVLTQIIENAVSTASVLLNVKSAIIYEKAEKIREELEHG